MSLSVLSRGALARVLQSLLLSELKRARGNGAGSAWVRLSTAWPETLQIAGDSPDGLGCDSLENLWLASAVNEMFRLYEASSEAQLLAASTFGMWLEIIEASWHRGLNQVTFMTSGSTGVPKRCVHPVSRLALEIDYLAKLFSTRKRVIAFTPAHHIYGFLFTAMLSDRLGIDVVSEESMNLHGFAHSLCEGDLIVSVPDRWQFLNRSIATWPNGVEGVVSTAPCPPGLIESLTSNGLAGMTEVYGSSETAGIGTRVWPDTSYRLMPHWRFQDTTALGETNLMHASGDVVALLDRISVAGDGTFRVMGRQDGAVQVGGINVFPARIAAVLRSRPGVADAAVRLMRPEEGSRLKAFVVPAAGEEQEAVRRDLEMWMVNGLTAVERPKSLTFGDVLPIGPLGKSADW